MARDLTRLRSRKAFNTLLATLRDYCSDYREHLNQEYGGNYGCLCVSYPDECAVLQAL